MKHIRIFLYTALLLLASLSSPRTFAADPVYNVYTPSSTTNAVAYSIIVPTYYHTAMNCYVDGAMMTLKKFYDGEAVASKKIEEKNVKKLNENLPVLCTQPWRADATLAELFRVEEGTVLNQRILDTMKKLYDGPTKEVELVRLIRQARDCVSKMQGNCSTPEAELYRIFMGEYDAYTGFLRARTAFVGDEEVEVTYWQQSQKNSGKSTEDQYVVFPTKQEEEITLAFQTNQTALFVLQEFMQTYPMYYEFVAIEQSLRDTGIELDRIQRAMTQLLLKLPAIMACQ